MKKSEDMPIWFWKLALVAAAAIWGGSFVVLKGAIEQVSPSWITGIRFLLTTVILCVMCGRQLKERLDRSHLACGALLGLFYGSGYVLQTIGLSHTTPGRNAFLTAVYCVLTPLIAWVVSRKRPGVSTFVAAVLCIVGVGFVSLGDDMVFSLGLGEWLSLACAVMYALHIVYVVRFSAGHDVMVLTVVQIAVTSALAFSVALLCHEPMPQVETFLEPDFLMSLAYLVLFSSCLASVIQNVGQSIVGPAKSSLLLSTECVFAVTMSILFYGEPITPTLVIGFSSIFAAVLISEVVPYSLVRRDELEGEPAQ